MDYRDSTAPLLKDKWRQFQYEITERALHFGLKESPTGWIPMDYEGIARIAARGGFPRRMPDWRFAKEYKRLVKDHQYGRSKIHELVINDHPFIAYVQESSTDLEFKTVMAHVAGHTDFFQRNQFFAHTPRGIMNIMIEHRQKYKEIEAREGIQEVRAFYESVKAIQNLIDYHGITLQRPDLDEERDMIRAMTEDEYVSMKLEVLVGGGPADSDDLDEKLTNAQNFDSTMDKYLNPTKVMEARKEQLRKEYQRIKHSTQVPLTPKRDVLKFLTKHGESLEPWQIMIIDMLRVEEYYFRPQIDTKAMNEGWAMFWQNKIMSDGDLTDFYQIEHARTPYLDSSEISAYAEFNAMVLHMPQGRFNPYKMGVELFRDIEYRWNTGRHGREFYDCDIADILDNWDEFVVYNNIMSQLADDKAKDEAVKKFQALKTWREEKSSDPTFTLGHYKVSDIWNRLYDPHSENKLYGGRPTSDVQARVRRELREFDKGFKRGAFKPRQDQRINPEWTAYARRIGRIPVGIGRTKIFDVAEKNNDISFYFNYLSEDFAVNMQLYTYTHEHTRSRSWLEIESRQFSDIRSQLLSNLANFGQPEIAVANGNFKNQKELRLDHKFSGVPLDMEHAEATLMCLERIWNRPVHITTTLVEKEDDDEAECDPQKLEHVILTYDGAGFDMNPWNPDTDF